MEFTRPDQGSDDALDSDVDPATGLVPISVFNNISMISAGLVSIEPTALRLVSLVARETTSGVAVEWGARVDSTTFGFEVYRGPDGDFANAVAVTEGVILTSSQDDIYRFVDTTVQIGQVYTYWIVERLQDQQTIPYGPAGIVTEGVQQIFLPFVRR